MAKEDLLAAMFGVPFPDLVNFLRLDVASLKPRHILVTRKFLGLTPQEMARVLQITEKTLAFWETGLSAPDSNCAAKFFFLRKVVEWHLFRASATYQKHTAKLKAQIKKLSKKPMADPLFSSENGSEPDPNECDSLDQFRRTLSVELGFEDEEEDEEQEVKEKPSENAILKMNDIQLRNLINKNDLDIDPDDYYGLGELRKAVIDELEREEDDDDGDDEDDEEE